MAWACFPGWVAMETQRIPLLSAASTLGSPRPDAFQAPAQHGSLLRGAVRHRGKAQSCAGAEPSPLDGTQAPAEGPGWPWGAEPSAAGCGLGVPEAAGGAGRCWAPGPSRLPPHAALGSVGAGSERYSDLG